MAAPVAAPPAAPPWVRSGSLAPQLHSNATQANVAMIRTL
jgi:hypothetical protein